MSAPRIAVLAPEPIRPRMAGMGIRALELARALSAEFGARLDGKLASEAVREFLRRREGT